MSKTEKKNQITPCMYDIIRSPVVTEKSQVATEQNKVSFYVSKCATKTKVKKAVQALFSVVVTKVNIINEEGKVKRFRGHLGKQSNHKKAIVTIAKGQTIDITATL